MQVSKVTHHKKKHTAKARTPQVQVQAHMQVSTVKHQKYQHTAKGEMPYFLPCILANNKYIQNV